MKLIKKTLCILMSALMLFTGLSAGMVGFAADDGLNDSYRLLAYAFFNYTKDTSLGSNANIVTKDEAGIPSMTILGDLDKYTSSTGSGGYKYAADDGTPIRSVEYSHIVTAKDDGNYTIRNATNVFLGIVDKVISYEYGVGLYTVPMIIEEVSDKLMYFKGDDGEYLFLDGYTYYTDMQGNIVERSDEPTYIVEDDGDIVYKTDMVEDELDKELSEEELELQQKIEDGVYTAKTLLEICDVESVIKYMCGNCTSVNSGNWFHDFEFRVYTDEETVLLTEGANLKNQNLILYDTVVKWTNDRSYDDSGLKAQYYNLGYTKTETGKTSSFRIQLKNFDTNLNSYFNKYYSPGVLDNATNVQLLNTYYSDITKNLSVFESISDAAKIAVFGQKAYSYVHLVTQLKPIVGASTGNIDDYAPTHTYSKYKDRYGNNVQFKVTSEKMSSFVSAIDALLSNPAITNVVGMFLDLSQFGVDLEANSNMTPIEAAKEVVANLLFSDDIVNMLIELIYPMVTNLLDDLLTNDFIEEELLSNLVDGIDLVGIIEAVANDATSWNALIYGVLASELGVYLTPAGMAKAWNDYKYTSDPLYSFCDMQKMHDMLRDAKGGITNDGAGHNTEPYAAIGCEKNTYYMDHWRDVDWTVMDWNIEEANGFEARKNRFLLALDAALAPLAPLLAVLLGDANAEMYAITALLIELVLVLNKGGTFHVYNDVIVPLFETLGITRENSGLLPGDTFEQNAKNFVNNRTAPNVATFLNDGLLNPLLNWVFNVLLKDPIQVVMTLLPNVSLYLTNGMLFSAVKTITIPIVLRLDPLGGLTNGASITVYTLNVAELLGDALDFLDSLQGVLSLINLGVDTGEGIVGYYSDDVGSTYMVFKPGQDGYDPDVHNIPTSVAYKNTYGNMNLYYSASEFNEEVTAMDEEGKFTKDALRGVVGYLNTDTNKIVDNMGIHQEIYQPLEEYYRYEVESEGYDPDLDEIVHTRVTYKVLTIDEVPEQYKESAELVQSYITIEEEIPLPPIMEYKLQACGTLIKDAYSCREGTYETTDRNGNKITFQDNKRDYIQMKVADKNGTHDSYGLVFLFVLRYALSALGYRGYSNGVYTSNYTLLDAFGLSGDMLTDELISGIGLTLGEIIYHVCLNPDEIIAALFELLLGGEQGSLFRLVDGVVTDGLDYSYAPKQINLYADEIFGAAEEHDDYQYGTAVLYNEYWTKEDGEFFVDNLDDIVEDVFAMLKLDDMESLSGFLQGLLDDLVFNNDMVTMIVSLVYSLLGSLEFDLGALLDGLLGVDYSKAALLESIEYKFDGVKTEMYTQLETQLRKGDTEYTDYTFSKASIDSETGEIVPGESYDWGFNDPKITAKYSNAEIFLRALSAAFGPFSILVEYIFMGEDINILDIVHIPMYEIFHYAWTPLMEALGATNGLISFKDYYTNVFANPKGDIAGGVDAFYYLLSPIVRFAEQVIASPIETVLNLIPNLIFVLSIGGLNGIVNNIAHFAYVLVDMLEPIVDVYPFVNKLLSNLDIGGFSLNLSIPLDIDLNQLVNELLDGLLGSLLSFDIENDNIVLGTQEVEKEVDVPVVDANGNQLYDKATGLPLTTKEMQTVTEEIYAVGTLNITLPYLDLTTLCSGTITQRTSVAGNRYIYLNSAGGADFITLVFRLVTDTLFYKDNWENIANFLIGFCDLDDEDDNDALLMEIFMLIHSKAQEARMNDVIMKFILILFQVLGPLADNLGERFKKVDFSVTEMFSDMDNLGTYASALMDAGEKNETLSGFAKIIQLIKDFFAMISEFFSKIFG